MLFGNQKTFAVEIELNGKAINNFLYGKFCYWIKGIQVGDYKFDTLLNDILLDLSMVASYCGKRAGEKLCGISAPELYELIEQSIYGEDFFEKSETDYTDVLNDSLKYKITLPLDIMTDWQGFLLECSEKELIIYKRVNEVTINSIVLPNGTFCKTIADAEKYLETLLVEFPH